MIRLLKTFAATMLLTPLLSISGDNSTMSDATMFNDFSVSRITSKSFQKNPPGSGVPVPDNKLGSNQSKSIVRYIGEFLYGRIAFSNSYEFFPV